MIQEKMKLELKINYSTYVVEFVLFLKHAAENGQTTPLPNTTVWQTFKMIDDLLSIWTI